MGSGNVAPAALMVSAEAAIVPAPASNTVQRIRFFTNRVPFYRGTARAVPIPVAGVSRRVSTRHARVRAPLKFWHAARQRVTDVEVDRAVVSLARGTRGNIPRLTRQVLVLTDQVDSAEARIGPHGL